MVTLIIATDFSQASQNASSYGVELASAIGADIVMAHAFSVPVTLPEPLYPVTTEEIKKTAEAKLLDEVIRLRKSDVQAIDIVAEEGDPVEMILDIASKYKQPLIVCGMKEESKALKKILGTTALSLLNKSLFPLIIVPSKAIYKPISRIAFATDVDLDTDMKTLDLLESIGNRLHAKMYIVRVVKENMSVVGELTYRSERLSEKFKNLQPEYVFPKSSNVTSGLQHFATEYDIDMLAIVSQKHKLADRLFVKSESKAEIFQTHIPLLILHEVKKEYDRSDKIFQKEYK